MALNYDIREVVEEAKQDGEPWRITEALIWATMAVDMGAITDANAQEFTERLAMSAMVHGTILQRMDGDKIVDRPITLEEVRLRIGLKTNVTTTSAAAYKNRLARAMRDKATEQLRADLRA